ncbi:MAG: TetR family transcriptional regulator [Aestuariivirgaceae bacterium]
MEDISADKLRVRQAAFALAERKPWHEITMAAIAQQSGLSISALMRNFESKAAILRDFSRDIDKAMLLVFERYPAEGEAHDRLFDVILKRLEIMLPYRPVIASVMKRPAGDPGDTAGMLQSLAVTVGWIAAAARVEDEPTWQSLGRVGLGRAYIKALSAWVGDDDPGLSRTMAALDRALRDWVAFSSRAGTVTAVLGGLAKAAGAAGRQFFGRGTTS